MDTISPAIFSTFGVIPLIGATWWLLAKGILVTRREVDGKDREIEWLRARNEEILDQYNLLAKEHAATTLAFFKDLRHVANKKAP